MTGDTEEPRTAGSHGARLLGDDDLLAILEEAIADERAAQQKYRRGLERCADPEACAVFEQLLREEQAHERVLRGALRGGQEAHRPAGRQPGLSRPARAGGDPSLGRRPPSLTERGSGSQHFFTQARPASP